MATYIHGKNAAFLFGGYRLSPWVNEVTTTQTTDTADTSHFESTSKTYIVGQNDGTVSFSGLYDGTAGAIQPVMAAVTALETPSSVTFTPEGITAGAAAILASGFRTTYEVNAVVSDVDQVSGDIQVSGGILSGIVVQEASAIAASGNSTSQDNAVATTLGAMANLHVIANTSNNTLIVKVQHSTDNSVWVDLITFTTVPSLGLTGETKTVTGTVNRYVRVLYTLAGTASVTIVVAVARN